MNKDETYRVMVLRDKLLELAKRIDAIGEEIHSVTDFLGDYHN